MCALHAVVNQAHRKATSEDDVAVCVSQPLFLYCFKDDIKFIPVTTDTEYRVVLSPIS